MACLCARCCSCCCCYWNCCEHHILFCDRAEPCDIDRIPRDHQEEDIWDDLTEEDIMKQTRFQECRRRWKWRLRRWSVRFCTFYYRVNPCNCLEGNTSVVFNARRQLSPRQGLLLISSVKMIVFLVFGILYYLDAVEKYGVYTHHKVEEDGVPRGDDWLKPNRDESKASKLVVQNINRRRAFCCSSYTALLLGIHILLYLLQFVSACNNCILPGLLFTGFYILPSAAVVVQPIIYEYLHKRYKWTDPRNGRSQIIDVTTRERGDVYPDGLYYMWTIFLLMIPYEFWIILWHTRQVKMDRLKRQGVIVAESSNDVIADPLDPRREVMTGIFMYEHLHPDRHPPTLAMPSYEMGQEVMVDNLTLSQLEIQWEEEPERIDEEQFKKKRRKKIKVKRNSKEVAEEESVITLE